jgi:hypothetical protein
MYTLQKVGKFEDNGSLGRYGRIILKWNVKYTLPS